MINKKGGMSIIKKRKAKNKVTERSKREKNKKKIGLGLYIQ